MQRVAKRRCHRLLASITKLGAVKLELGIGALMSVSVEGRRQSFLVASVGFGTQYVQFLADVELIYYIKLAQVCKCARRPQEEARC